MSSGPRPSHNPNYPFEPEETPLLKASPDFWWMNEVDRSNAFEARALASGAHCRIYFEGAIEWAWYCVCAPYSGDVSVIPLKQTKKVQLRQAIVMILEVAPEF